MNLKFFNDLLLKEKASFPLLPNYEIFQIFKTEEDFNFIELHFGCYNRKNTCSLKFSLFKIINLQAFDLEEIYSQNINAIQLSDYESFYINFPSIINAKNQHYCFSITSSDSDVTNCVCLWLNNFSNNSFYIKNTTNDLGSIVFRYGSREEKLQKPKTFDIIICVFNQIDLVKKCINSIKINTKYQFYRIIVINDGSFEETTSELQKIENIELINLDQNVGYVKAANIGLKKSTADFKILLNSDTEVTFGWLLKILKCEKVNPNTGIFGLCSNNATWQSVPKSYLESKYQNIPFPYNLNTFSLEIEKLSEKKYPLVPHVHGSCFIIKKEVIEKIGYFDELNFNMGYHEEDDFCLRALEAGFDLRWIDDTFYFHHAHKSFTPEKREILIKQNTPYYLAKWGEKDKDYIEFLKNKNPLDYLREKLQIKINQTLEEIKNLKIGYLLNPGARSGGSISIFQILNYLKENNYNARLVMDAKSFKNLKGFSEFNINYFVYQTYPDLLNEKFDILIGTHNHTIEDLLATYYNVNPNCIPGYFIQDFEPYFYDKNSMEYQKALRSYSIIPNITAIAKTQWICDTVFEKTKLKVYKAPPGLNTKLFKSNYSKSFSFPLKVSAMIRPQTPRRNPEMTLKVLKQIKEKYQEKVEIFIFGSTEETLKTYNLKTEEYKFDYKNLGLLNSGELSELFNNSHIFLDGSIYQAFGRTSLEAMACGCISIVPKNGGSLEYAKHLINSLVVDTSSEKEILETFDFCFNQIKDLYQISNNAIEDASKYTIENEALKHLEIFYESYRKKEKNLIEVSPSPQRIEINLNDKGNDIIYIHQDNTFLQNILLPIIDQFPNNQFYILPKEHLNLNLIKKRKNIKVKNLTIYQGLLKYSIIAILPFYWNNDTEKYFIDSIKSKNLILTYEQMITFLPKEITDNFIKSSSDWQIIIKKLLKNPKYRTDLAINSYNALLKSFKYV